MKIMHVVLSLEYGGAEKVAVNLIKKLHGDEFNFSICALDKLGPVNEELDGSIVVECVNRVQGGLDFGLPFRLAKAMKRIAPDIVHMHNPTPLLYGTIAAKLAGINNLVVTQHGSITKESKRMRFALNRMSHFIDKTVPVSRDIENYLRAMHRIDGAGLELIINGIDIDLYKKNSSSKNETKEKLGIIKGELVIGNVARLSPEKNQAGLLEAFSLALKQRDGLKLVIVGAGPLKEELEALARELDISDKVIFTGGQENVASFLNIFDLFVLSSMREGTSLTLLEAMSAQLPVIATDVGGNGKVVVNNETGILVPARDAEALAKAIVHLAADDGIREKMGLAGRKRIEEHFSLDGMAGKYASVYRKLMAK